MSQSCLFQAFQKNNEKKQSQGLKKIPCITLTPSSHHVLWCYVWLRFIRDLATSDDGNQKSETKPIVDSMKYCVHQLRLLVEIDHYLQGVLAPSQKVVVGQIFSINSIISSKK